MSGLESVPVQGFNFKSLVKTNVTLRYKICFYAFKLVNKRIELNRWRIYKSSVLNAKTSNVITLTFIIHFWKTKTYKKLGTSTIHFSSNTVKLIAYRPTQHNCAISVLLEIPVVCGIREGYYFIISCPLRPKKLSTFLTHFRNFSCVRHTREILFHNLLSSET